MALIKSLLMSAKNRNYDPMSEDGYDSKIPLHNDEAFQHGIQYNAKFIGSLEVPKPTSRVEIVAAMRRIRYEFKAKAVKKRKVSLSISVDGLKVSLSQKKQKDPYFDENKYLLIQHPIYRVFYVSHDSQDLKIFSFIARDNINNSFRCNVFKAYKKNEAMRIVRTIGQAFEVCHKLSLQQKSPPKTSINSPSLENDSTIKQQTNRETLAPNMDPMEKAERYLQSVQISPTTESKSINLFQSHSSSEFTLKHQMQFMQEQLQQMQSESELAFNQIKLIKEQLNIEITARIDAQNKNTQLLQRNRELLTHIQQLLLYTNELEMKLTNKNIDSLKILPPRPTDLLLLPSLFSTLTSSGSSNEHCLSSDSPDSGKGKEISSESISDPFLPILPDQQRNNSIKTFSMTDDLTTQSMSINDTQQHVSAYDSTSPSLTSSSRSSANSMKISKKKKSQNSTEYYHYQPISSSNGSSSFTNTAFTQSPLRTVTKEFDPLMKSN